MQPGFYAFILCKRQARIASIVFCRAPPFSVSFLRLQKAPAAAWRIMRFASSHLRELRFVIASRAARRAFFIRCWFTILHLHHWRDPAGIHGSHCISSCRLLPALRFVVISLGHRMPLCFRNFAQKWREPVTFRRNCDSAVQRAISALQAQKHNENCCFGCCFAMSLPLFCY